MFVTAVIAAGAMIPAAAADDVFSTEQLIKGGNADSFNKNYGKSITENVNHFGGAPHGNPRHQNRRHRSRRGRTFLEPSPVPDQVAPAAPQPPVKSQPPAKGAAEVRCAARRIPVESPVPSRPASRAPTPRGSDIECAEAPMGRLRLDQREYLALVRTDLAAGDPEGARQETIHALDLFGTISSHRVGDRLTELHNEALPYANSAPAIDLRERITHALG
ncbi:hypothetical protein [Streptomyces atratus]|uniref:hypothetical protein n=1 Tax=Streptomyces atratus TaxID=1893 RepID=UPI0021A85A3E|nr:hypothetical protein [Streptomyces atratus]MCT2543401.1 hypothetical protein [Streptomyces atratus]